MDVREAQREVRSVYLGGAPGQAVSGALWLASAALASAGAPRRAMAVLVIGGFFIYPVTMLLLKLLGRRASLARGNPLGALAMQVAFTVPAGLPLVWAATVHRAEWFYPSFMILVGAHYLPFVFLYGMRHFAVLAGLLVAGGVFLLAAPGAPLATGGWATGAVLVAFAALGGALARSEARAGA
uniref:Uncharacterized protein n=1 Tax=Eiseniibacteriota bacterium TaxID=2212470 RepID=A0A832MLV5_UNCEI